MNQALQKNENFSFAPKDLSEALQFAKILSRSDFVPKCYVGKPENIMVSIQYGAEIGLKPLQSLQGIAVINGIPSVWGDSLLALVQSHPDFQDIIETDDGNIATCTIKRKEREPRTVTFSIEDAKRARLHGKSGPWSAYPARMRQMRARSFAIRDMFADVLKGLSTTEEVQDIPRDNFTPELKVINPADEITHLDFIENKLEEGEIITNETPEIIPVASSDSVSLLEDLILENELTSETIVRWLEKADVENLHDMTQEQVNACIKSLSK